MRIIICQFSLIFCILRKKNKPNCEKRNYINDPKWREIVWHYPPIKKLSTLLRGITSNNNGDFYCLNCLHSFRTEIQLRSPGKVCKNKDLCGIVTSLKTIIC